MSNPLTIMWFRQDLRLDDNPALSAALAAGRVLPIYILEDCEDWLLGAASAWWLHHSLQALNQSLQGKLWVFSGDPESLLPDLASELGAAAVHWNRCYEPWRIDRDKRIKQRLTENGVSATSHNGSLLWEPWENLKQDGSPYKVFTPFFKYAIANNTPLQPQPLPDKKLMLADCTQPADRIDALGLRPKINWYEEMTTSWTPGELGARQRLEEFLDDGLGTYQEGRDFPAMRSVSRLSPHLHFGEISPRQAVHAVGQRANVDATENQAEHFIRELGWREFSYYSLYHFPKLTGQNLKSQFDRFPWLKDEDGLRRWQSGTTGYPLVDAGMRELWQTGYMHNRVRMIVGSFLVKNLMIHWLEGARWFWDCLVDADLANNSCSWQWVAGSGADASPYFRIFNPVTQSKKFDPKGRYIKQWLPELSKLEGDALHDPSSARAEDLAAAGVVLGEHYPEAIVELKATRERALNAYKTLKG